MKMVVVDRVNDRCILPKLLPIRSLVVALRGTVSYSC